MQQSSSGDRMDEQEFFKGSGVLVTSARIEIGGQTFATRNVGSVKVTAPGLSKLALVIAIIGAAACAGGSYVFGVSALAVGGIWAFTTMRKRKLLLVAGGGEILALETSDSALVERIRTSIAAAISVR